MFLWGWGQEGLWGSGVGNFGGVHGEVFHNGAGGGEMIKNWYERVCWGGMRAP